MGPERSRLRVLMLIGKMVHGGGAERTMVALATHLPRDRFDVTIATTRPSAGPLLERVHANGIRHLALDRRHRLDVAAFRRLGRFLRQERIDVLHSHLFGSNLWGSIFGRLTSVPAVIAHEHTWSYEGQPWRRVLDGQIIGRLADTFVSVSERDRARMIELERVPARKVVVLPNPYIPRTGQGEVDLRRQLGLAPDAPVVATAAVLRPQKALEVLVDAFAEVAAALPDAVLVIAGDGPCRAALEQRVRDRRLAERVTFLGWFNDVTSLLAAADVAALSSDYEGAPLFALECMVHRTPLVSTDVGNVAETFGDGRGVTIVPRRDPAALGAAVTALLRDADRRAAQAAVAAERMQRYQVDNVVGEFAALYERLVFDGAARRRRSG